jgi:hypothetical protein
MSERLGGPITEDPRARKILFDTFWTSAGWRSERTTDPADLSYARAAGYMFEPRGGTHDDWVARARAVADKVTLAEAASAFVASLGSRQLAARSALGSLASVRHLAPHPFRPWSASCGECSNHNSDRPENLDVLSFERHKWGGVRHGQPTYAWFDLDIFARSERPTETPGDVDILNRLLDVARQVDPDARPADLERAIAPLLPSSKDERRTLLGILAMCNVLAPPDHPGLLARWVPYTDRQPPPKPSKNDWMYPMFWWRGSFGVNEAAARDVFGARIR